LHEAKLQEEVERAVAAEVAASAGDIVSSIRQRLAL
jgi:hypothetical protein